MTNGPRLFIAALLIATVAVAQPPSRWQLAWSDEFDGPAMSPPDPAKWKFEAGGGGWGNNEEEVYCAPASDKSPCRSAIPNIYLDGAGHLIVRANQNSGTWTSGRMITKGKEEVQYGRIEARMKLPQGAGVWPAFWLLGADIDSAGWPACGEIDVMENVPMLGATKVQATIHGPKSQGTGTGVPFTFALGERVDTDFHTYGFIWGAGRMQFYVDDFEHPFFTITKETAMPGDWAYDHPFFLLLNLAIGGNWPGHSDATTPRPALMAVDWVRVYKEIK